MLVNGIEYTGSKLVATNNSNSELYIAKQKYINLWRFIVKFKNQDAFITGSPFETQKEAMQYINEYTVLADLSVENVIVKTIALTEDQKVAINTAIMLISQYESDHADQCLFYLNQIKG